MNIFALFNWLYSSTDRTRVSEALNSGSIPDKVTRIWLFLQPKAQFYFAEALKIYFQKTRQGRIEKCAAFCKNKQMLVRPPPRGTAQLFLIRLP